MRVIFKHIRTWFSALRKIHKLDRNQIPFQLYTLSSRLNELKLSFWRKRLKMWSKKSHCVSLMFDF